MTAHFGRPRFSVVVPAYNEAACIGATLAALHGQDFAGAVEVIVVDNNSTDETAAIARSYGATVLHEPRAGVCFARQTGTLAATGEVVVSTDADTTTAPGWLTAIDASFRARPDAVGVGGPCAFVDGPWWGKPYGTLLFGLVDLIFRLTGRVLYVSATNIAFRRDAFPGYDTELTQGGDELDLLRNLRRRGPFLFDGRNPTFTSSRRLERGLFYNLFVTMIWFYLVGYAANRLAGRRVMGTAPHIRPGSTPTPWHRSRTLAASVVALAAAALVWHQATAGAS